LLFLGFQSEKQSSHYIAGSNKGYFFKEYQSPLFPRENSKKECVQLNFLTRYRVVLILGIYCCFCFHTHC